MGQMGLQVEVVVSPKGLGFHQIVTPTELELQMKLTTI